MSDRPGRASWRLAGLISTVFCPPVLAVCSAVLLTLWPAEPSPVTDWAGLGLFLVFCVALPVGYVLRLRRTGRIEGLFIADGPDRARPLFVASACCLLGAILMVAVSQPGPLSTVLTWYGGFGLLAGLVTRRHRTSLHAAGAWGAAVNVAYFCGHLGWVFLPVAVSVVWARHTRGAHTLVQLVSGSVAGAATAWGALRLADVASRLQ